jgi:hypothetical protein
MVLKEHLETHTVHVDPDVITNEIDGLYNSGYRVMVDGIQIIANHPTRPTARGKIVGHRGNIKFANGKVFTFEFDTDHKIIYFDGRKSGKTWTKKKNYVAVYKEKMTEARDKKKNLNLFSFTDLIPEKYRSRSVQSRNIKVAPQGSTESVVSKSL